MDSNAPDVEKIANSLLSLLILLQQKVIRPGAVISRHDLSPHQFQALAVLMTEGPLHAGELGNRLMISKQQASLLIKRLSVIEMVQHEPDAYDKRMTKIVLTDRARQVMENKRIELSTMIQTQFSQLNPNQLSRLETGIGQLKEVLSEINQQDNLAWCRKPDSRCD